MKKNLLVAACVLGFSGVAGAQVVDGSVCDVVNHPDKFDGKVVKLTGVVQVGFDSFLMRGDTCSSSLWLSYPAGTKAKAGPATTITLQLASNATGTTGTARPAVTLERGPAFEQFDSLLAAKVKTPGMCLGCVKNNVKATLVGRVDGTVNAGLTRDAAGKVTSLDGFGNLNQYSARMVIQSVADVTAQEIDFSKLPKVKDDNQGGSGKDYLGATKKAEDAFAKGTDAPAQIDRSVAAFGAPGQANGVVVAFGGANEVPEGEGTKSAQSSPDGLLLTVHVDGDKLKGDALSRAMAHQGTEIVDVRATTGSKGYKDMQQEAWQTALLVTIGARQKSLTLPGAILFWNEGWTAEERSGKSSEALNQYLTDHEQTPR